MTVRSNKSRSLYRFLYTLLFLFVVIYLIYKAVLSFSHSLFVTSRTRINLVVYGNDSTFYSIDKKDARHYVMYFAPDLKMQVPGGYGDYRVGSLGKLVSLEKKPELFAKTFSVATTSFVNYYFYPGGEDVYYGKEIPKDKKTPKATDFLFDKSNAGIFDRLYLALFFISKNAEDFTGIDYSEKVNAIQNDVYFQDESFVKESIGLLYQTLYRDEQKSVQILYKKDYVVAQNLSNILEGNGIRVNDLSLDLNGSKSCSIIENTTNHSKTAEDMAEFFNCQLKKGPTDVYDIIFILGNREVEWE